MMKWMRGLVLGLAVLAIGLGAQAQQRTLSVQKVGGNRIALVIGNDSYRSVEILRNARADARAMAAALTNAGFTVTMMLDTDEKTLKSALRNFKARISGGDEAIFYYSGHGVQLGTSNYLLPIDIRGENEEQIKDDAVPLQRVLDDLQDQKARFSLAIVDACRNNPFRQAGRALGGRGLAPTTPATGQMVIYSAGTGQQALDRLGDADRNQNGLFTRVFLKEMDKPGLPVNQVLRNVREEVVRLAKSVNHEQVPALYDQALGDFFFRPGNAGVPATNTATTTTVPGIDQSANERTFWDSIKSSSDINDFRAYVSQFPNGTFRALADNRIAALSRTTPPPVQVATISNTPVVQDIPAATGQRPPNSSWTPSRPVRIIMPFAAGGASDIVARILGQAMSESIGQPFIVDNRPGAGGIIGMDLVSKSPPDGYSLLITSGSSVTAAPGLYKNLPLDVRTGLQPIAQVANSPQLLVTSPSSGLNSPRDLVSRESTFASAGTGSFSHLVGESLKLALGAGRAIHVPYKGTGPALADLIGGSVQWMFVDPSFSMPHLQAGKLRALAATGNTRVAALPSVPVFQELGISGMNLTNWYGVWAPGGTPSSIVARYYNEISKAVRGSARERIVQLGMQPADLPPDDLAQLVRAESANLGEIIRSAGITMQ